MKKYINRDWIPIINQYKNKVGLTKKVVEACKMEQPECHEQLIEGYKKVYWPFYVWKLPIGEFGFGQFVAYFSRLVSKSDTGAFLYSSKAYREEEKIERYLLDIWHKMTGSDKWLSVYELPNLLQAPPDKKGQKIASFIPRNVLEKRFTVWT